MIVAMVLLSGLTGARTMGGEPRGGMPARQTGGEWRWGLDSTGVEMDTVRVVDVALDSLLAANEGKMSPKRLSVTYGASAERFSSR